MGPYCQFCDHRCFLPRIVGTSSVILATCPRGMAQDRERCGHDHRTALNPATQTVDLAVYTSTLSVDVPCAYKPGCLLDIKRGEKHAAVSHLRDQHDRVEHLHIACLTEVYHLDMRAADAEIFREPAIPEMAPERRWHPAADAPTTRPVVECPCCESKDLAWSWAPQTTSGVADGRLRASEVRSMFYLFCQSCSETLYTVDPDEVAAILNTARVRPTPEPSPAVQP